MTERRPPNIEDAYPLAPLQEGMLFHTLFEPESGVYTEQLAFRMRDGEGFDPEAFHSACRGILKRHPILRTAFAWRGKKRPMQVVRRKVRVPVTVEDWTALSAAEAEERFAEVLEEDRRRGFDLNRAPLLRIAVYRLNRCDCRCVLSYHHILMDAWSLPRVFAELMELYTAHCQGRQVDLPPTRPYREYIAWLKSRDMTVTEAFWRETLAGFTSPTPLGVDRLPGTSLAGLGEDHYDRQGVLFPPDLGLALEGFARRHRLTLSTVLHGAWALLLSRYSGETDVLFGTTVSGRPESLPGVETIVGLFINTLPSRTPVPPRQTLPPWLTAIQKAQLALRDHEHTPLVEVQGWSEVPRHLPLFQSLLVVENAPVTASSGAEAPTGNHRLEVVESRYLPQSNYPISVMMVPGGQMAVRVLTQRRHLDRATARRVAGHLRTLLTAMVATRDGRLESLPLLTAAERHQLVLGWNDTATAFRSAATLHQLFDEQVERTPDAPAVVDAEGSLTYRQVWKRSNRLAHHLRRRGLERGGLVAVHLRRSARMVVAVLAVVKAGGAYVPLEASLPVARVEWILRAMDIRHRIVASAEQIAVPDPGHAVEDVDLSTLDLAALPPQPPQPRAAAEDLAYIIFTSGTTGTPKGVMERHRPVVNLVQWVNTTFGFGPRDRVLFTSSLSFDLSVYDIFGLLAVGGSVRVASQEEMETPARLLRILHREPITFWDSAPAGLQQVLAFAGQEPPAEDSTLRLAFLSGDWIPVHLPARLREEFPNARLIALGGATEATIWSNVYPVSTVPEHWISIPYGRPIHNAAYHVLDPRMEPCPIGVPGDLYIGGDCLASGYAREPALTAGKFLPDPFRAVPGSVLYRTGDRARLWGDGLIEFLGRRDQQVKIRGFRIELGEIATTLGEHPQVADAVVLALGDPRGDRRLVAYLVPAAGTSPQPSALETYLAERLPRYMVPSAWISLESFPVTVNGKLDRAALAALAEETRAEGETVPPRDPTELWLVRLWEEALDQRPLGVRDDFFALGGHSLMAVRLLARIQKRLERDLPLRTLFDAPTIEALARQLRQLPQEAPGDAGEWSPLVTLLEPRGEAPTVPLFCVHPGGGSALAFAGLARHLVSDGVDRPCYAFQARGLEAGQQPGTSIPPIAEEYVAWIRRTQPQGPYQVTGWSFGGFVAYEIAQRLVAAGEEVALLAMLDTGVWKGARSSDRELLGDLVGEMVGEVNLEEMHRQGNLEAQLAYVVEQARQRHLVPPDFRLEEARRMFAVHRASLGAAAAYQPAPYAGSLTLFRAADRRQDEDETLGWGRLAAGAVEVVVTPGSHETLLRPPHDVALAERLRPYLIGRVD